MSTQLERAALGALMVEPAALRSVDLRDSDFAERRHREIFRAMAALDAEGQPVDVATICTQLGDELAGVGGPAFIAALDQDLPDPGRLPEHAALLRTHAARRRLIEAARLTVDTGASPGAVERLDAARAAMGADGGRDGDAGWEVIDLGTLDDEEDDLPSVLQTDAGGCLLYRRCVNSLAGEPEALKTWTALWAARQELLAGETVALLDYEDSPRQIRSRLRALGVSKEALTRLLYVQPEAPVARAEAAVQALLDRRPSLIILDGVTEAMTLEGLSLLDNAEVSEFFRRLPRRLAASGAAVLLLDHVTKAAEGRGRWAIGAQAKLAGVTGAAYTIRVSLPFGRGQVGKARLFLAKDRRGHIEADGQQRHVADITASSNGSAVVLRIGAPTGEAFKPTFLMERVSRALEDRTEGATQTWVRENVTGKKSAVLLALRQLVEDGYVRREDDDRANTRGSFVSARPYRDEENRPPDSGAELEVETTMAPTAPPPPYRAGAEGAVFSGGQNRPRGRSGGEGGVDG